MTSDDLYDLILSLKEATEIGFLRVADRFDGVDKRLDGIDGRLDRIDGRLGRLETRVEAVEEALVAVRGDIANLQRRAW